MALSDFQRTYNMTNADLCMFVSNLVNFITRDASQFAAYSVLTADITAFKGLGDAFEDLPSDEELLADISIATEDKNAKADELRIGIRSIAIRAENKWGANSARYRKFGVIGMNRLNDRDLLDCARRVHRTGTTYLTDLASEGLTTGVLTAFNTLTNDFELTLNAFDDAVAERDIKAEERMIRGNELYANAVKYCNIGKQIWADVSPAKYNDYLIYTGSSPGSLEAPTGLAFDSLTQTFRWNEVTNATSYILQESGDGEVFNTVYSGPNLSVGFEPTNAGKNYYIVKSRNSGGLSLASDVITVEYYSILPVPDNLNAVLESPNTVNFTFSPVPTADRYLLFRNVVELGAPAGVFNPMGETALNYYIGPIEQGKRTYYKVKAAVDLRESDFSHYVYLDVPVAPV